MNGSQQTEALGEAAPHAQAVAWSYEWYGTTDEGPTQWHKRLSEHHPTDGLPASQAKDYRNIRALAYADGLQAAGLGAAAPALGSLSTR